MSVWSRISEKISQFSHGDSLHEKIEETHKEPENSVTFTIAVISLSAKIAKADGLVTQDEIAAFREIFYIEKRDEEKAALVYNLARKDVAGFEAYARSIARMFESRKEAKENIVEGLFHIAVADGNYHPAEDDYVHQVAQIFSIDEHEFRAMRARFVPNQTSDPYEILGATSSMPLAEIRKRWRDAVRKSHPDTLIASGLPEEAVAMATKRLIAVNTAWEEIYSEHENR